MEKSDAHSASDATLKYSGFAYLLGDAALFTHGMLNGRPDRALTGLSWGLGGLALAGYGKQPDERSLRRTARELGHYLQARGVKLPEGHAITREALREPGLWEKMQDFLYDHPSQALNTVYGVGSAFLLRSGLKSGDKYEAASGALVMAGALAGLLISEKTSKETQRDGEASPLTDPIGWVQEKPLRLSSTLYTLNNVSLAKSGWDEMRANPANKSYLLKYLTVASFVLANHLLGKSNKDRDKDRNTEWLETLEDEAAAIIAAQPKETQEKLVRAVADYLQEKGLSDLPPQDIRTALQDRVRRTPAKTVASADTQGRIHTARAAFID